jgi:hypothetical protein
MTDTTDTILAGMLTENTGRHLLDSGDTYGRHWQRNAGMTVGDFLARPEVTPGIFTHDGVTTVDYVTLDVFHFLRHRVTYNAELTSAFNAYESERDSYESWPAVITSWLDFVGARCEGADPVSYNTANGEDYLSQVLQFWIFDGDYGDHHVVLQVHGGCDVRGGYTAPKVFDLADRYTLFDNAEVYVNLFDGDDQVGYLWVRGCEVEDADIASGYDVDFKFGRTPVQVTDQGIYLPEGLRIEFVAPCP